ncbi:MAG: DUF2312 domain-containing protein [Alphaproteobacteria bacterium]|nr:DUF2312 domain-containing protein [Alphaproteobacteria bacterium]
MSEDNVNVVGVDSSKLISYIERIERLEEEKKSVQNDIREIFAEVKGNNFDVNAVKEIIKIRKALLKNKVEQQAYQFTLDQYKSALGMD